MALQTRSAPVQSIPAGSTATTQAAVVLDNGSSYAYHMLISTASAGVSAGAVQLQVSHDNVNWFPAGTAVTLTASTVQNQVLTGPAQYVRAQITTTVVGGTVGCTVASA